MINELPEMALNVDSTTIHLVSNGNVFYWIRSSPNCSRISNLSQAGHLIFVDVFEIDRETSLPKMTQPRIVLNKNPIATLKIIQYLSDGDNPSLGKFRDLFNKFKGKQGRNWEKGSFIVTFNSRIRKLSQKVRNNKDLRLTPRFYFKGYQRDN